ncbi:hypothetical protein [Pseudomonas sp. S2_A02]
MRYLIILMLLLSSSLACAGGRDDNWWIRQSYELKLTFMVGMIDGAQTGSTFSAGVVNESLAHVSSNNPTWRKNMMV